MHKSSENRRNLSKAIPNIKTPYTSHDMSRFSAIHFLVLISLASCTTAPQQQSRVEYLPFYEEATFTPRWMTPEDPKLSEFHSIPDFTLINQLGDTITEQSVEGKIYVADFFFSTCPGICPKMTDNMTMLQEAFLEDEDILLLSHSVMPTWDSVDVLHAYGQEHGVEPHKWYLLTGEMEEIYDLGRNHYFVEEDLGLAKSVDDFLHTENFVLVDKQRHIRGIYNGLNKTSVRQLITDIKSLQQESS